MYTQKTVSSFLAAMMFLSSTPVFANGVAGLKSLNRTSEVSLQSSPNTTRFIDLLSDEKSSPDEIAEFLIMAKTTGQDLNVMLDELVRMNVIKQATVNEVLKAFAEQGIDSPTQEDVIAFAENFQTAQGNSYMYGRLDANLFVLGSSVVIAVLFMALIL